MKLFNQLTNGETKLSLIGLGYVGMPIAVAFARKVKVIGFDLNGEKIRQYQNGTDPTHEVGDEVIRNTTVEFTSDPKHLQEARFHIVAVPTPIHEDHTPDLGPVESASRILGENLKPGSIVVFESTVYPGVTEEVCVPILERESGLKCGVDFKVGYSPERINPGDKAHRLENIRKIVSGMDEETLDQVAKVYELVVAAGVHRAPSIKVAEAAKVIENSQRDINIAFMNELSIIFNKMGIDTQSVLAAAGTKWNFLNFRPGLVGGHCIGVDPYYLTHKAQSLGYLPEVILAGRRINDGMGKYVVSEVVKLMIRKEQKILGANVLQLGITFKENCPDTRNSHAVDVARGMTEFGCKVDIWDPWADPEEIRREYGLESVRDAADLKGKKYGAIILAVAHRQFLGVSLADFRDENCVVFDVKSILPREEIDGRL